MKKKQDYPLSRHFYFHEMIEGSLMSPEGHAMNWVHIDECDEMALKKFCARMEVVRADINAKFMSDLGFDQIPLIVSSGWRCRAWELHRGRSGNSQHTIAAMDVYPGNCSKALSDKIMLYIEKKYFPRATGWQGGFAIQRPTAKRTGFAHFDGRPKVARWWY
jgi:hypothetical protein